MQTSAEIVDVKQIDSMYINVWATTTATKRQEKKEEDKNRPRLQIYHFIVFW